MGTRINPMTGLEEDDGVVDPLAMPNVGPQVDAAVPPGGGGGGGTDLTVNYPARPETVDTTSVATHQQTAKGVAADAAVDAATGKQLASIDTMKNVGNQEDALRATAIKEKGDRLDLQKRQEELAQIELDHAKQKGREEDDRLLADSLEKKKAAGSAREDFFKGNPGGAFIASVLRGIDRAASSFRGETGPTGSDRILTEAIDNHEKGAIAKWQASEEARKAFHAGQAEYEKQLALVKGQIANQTLHDLSTIELRLDSSLAGLSPAKREAEAGKAKAELEAKKAEALQKREDARDIVVRNSLTKNSPTAPSSGNAALEYKKSQDNLGRTVNDPVTGKPLGLANTEQLAKEVNDNGAKIARVNTDIARIREINKQLPAAITGVKGAVDAATGMLDPKVQALKQEAQTLREGILPQVTQMNGAGAPSNAERDGLVSSLQRGLLQNPESFDKALAGSMKAILTKWHSQLPSAGVVKQEASKSTANPDAAPRKEAPAPKAAPKAAPASAAPTEGETVTFGGKTYIIKDGKAVPQ